MRKDNRVSLKESIYEYNTSHNSSSKLVPKLFEHMSKESRDAMKPSIVMRNTRLVKAELLNSNNMAACESTFGDIQKSNTVNYPNSLAVR